MTSGIALGQVYALGSQATLIVVSRSAEHGYLWRCLVIDYTDEAPLDGILLWYTYSFIKERCQQVA